MSPKFLLVIIAMVSLASCSTAYKAGQTPDDVYYSPAREVAAKKDTRSNEQKYEDYQSDTDDQYLRLKVRNRYSWSRIDDYDYWYDSRYNYNYNYGYNTYSYGNFYNPHGFYNYYNPYGFGNYYGSPYFPVIFYKNPKVYTGYTAKSNITAFKSSYYNNVNAQNYKTGYYTTSPSRNFNNTNSNATGTQGNGTRTFQTTTPSSNTGGRSGGYNSSGSSTTTPRKGRG